MVMQRALILGAAGRDFHNFNVFFRDNADYQVVAFTATQIPNIAGRRYPPALAGQRYPEGVPIEAEDDLPTMIRDRHVDVVVFSYSDISHEYVMHRASEALAAGADYLLLGPRHTMLRARVPIVAVCAARTGSGKSQTTRRVATLLKEAGHRVVVVRHPMPYGDLAAQAVQRFASATDLDRHRVTIEEREEYEPLIGAGHVVYAGVDYERILRQAEAEAQDVLALLDALGLDAVDYVGTSMGGLTAMALARKAAGDNFILMADANQGYSREEAIRFAQKAGVKIPMRKD